jgi:hypothetical protein
MNIQGWTSGNFIRINIKFLVNFFHLFTYMFGIFCLLNANLTSFGKHLETIVTIFLKKAN